VTDNIKDDIRKRHALPDETELTTADLAGAHQPKSRPAHELLTETESESRGYPAAPVKSDKGSTHAAAVAPAMERETGPLFFQQRSQRTSFSLGRHTSRVRRRAPSRCRASRQFGRRNHERLAEIFADERSKAERCYGRGSHSRELEKNRHSRPERAGG
jgi:hypothetical protein